MIILKEILLEGNRTKGIKMADAVRIFNSSGIGLDNFTKIINADTLIYRGLNWQSNTRTINIVKPKDTIRDIRGAAGFYTFLFSEYLKNWKDFPNREYSVFASNDEDVSSDYGSLFIMIPVEMQETIVFSNNSDFLYSFGVINNMESLWSGINWLMEYVDIKSFPVNNFKINEIDRYFELLDDKKDILFDKFFDNSGDFKDKMDYILNENGVDRLMENWYLQNHLTFKELLEIELDPYANEFKLYNIRDYYSGKNTIEFMELNQRNREIWTKSNSLLIQKGRTFANFLTKIGYKA